MAWSWSHTVEAYADAEANLQDQSHEWLVECAAEWRVTTYDEYGFVPQFGEHDYGDAVREMGKWSKEALASTIWENAQELRLCDNGGFNAWMCPYGCHTVPFSRSGDEGEE